MPVEGRWGRIVLVNLLSLAAGIGIVWAGAWWVTVVMAVQGFLAAFNCSYSGRTGAAFLLNGLMAACSLISSFCGNVLWLLRTGKESMLLAELFAVQIMYSLFLALTSTLWGAARRKAGSGKRVLRLLAALTLGAALAFALLTLEFLTGHKWMSQLGQLQLPAVLVGLVLSQLASVVFHELGHLLMGLLAGYRLLSFRLGSFVWKRENRRLVLRREPVAGIGGACAMLPPAVWSRRGSLLFMAGGVLANLLTGLVSQMLPLTGAARSGAAIFTLISLVNAIANALPLYTAGNPTDGRCFWMLLLRTAEGERLMAYQRQSQRLMAGVRPRDLEPLPPMPQAPKGADLQARLAGAYFRALDSGDWQEAGAALAELEARISEFPSVALHALCYELCFYNGVNGQQERAGEFRAKAAHVLERDGDMNGLRVRAYCAWYLDGDADEARTLCRQGLAVAENFPIPGQALMERDLIEELLTRLPEEKIYSNLH